MAKDYQEIDDRIRRWIEAQHLFFVSTAPNAADGLINCSPKGLDGLRVLGPRQIAYADTGGSGIETVAHLRENGRIVIMMCAFRGPPKIYRFYGSGRVLEPQDDGFEAMADKFGKMPAIRNFIIVDIDRIRDSCGYGVPFYDYQGERDSLPNFFQDKSVEEIVEYRIDRNEKSLDGLPGLDPERVRQLLEKPSES